MAKERVDRDEEDLVRLYLTDIGQYPLLTKEGEVRLAQQIEAGTSATAESDARGAKITPARRRELRRSIRRGDEAQPRSADAGQSFRLLSERLWIG